MDPWENGDERRSARNDPLLRECCFVLVSEASAFKDFDFESLLIFGLDAVLYVCTLFAGDSSESLVLQDGERIPSTGCVFMVGATSLPFVEERLPVSTEEAVPGGLYIAAPE